MNNVIYYLHILIALLVTSLIYVWYFYDKKVTKLTKDFVSHQKELEELLNLRNDQILNQSKYSELGMMSAGIAHEINNPLTVIQAKVSQLLRYYKDPNRLNDLGQGLEQILYTSERINRTIQGVRDFVHQDENLTINHFSLKTLIEDVLAFCGQRFKNHGINLRLYGFDHVMIRGHKIQIEQVLLNLLNNSFDAIEFLPEKWIELSATESDTGVIITIKDSGHGIPREIAEKMMTPFFTTKKNGKGTGLGLVLAKGIIEKHGGKFSFISEAAHTTFQIELPRSCDSVAVYHHDRDLVSLH
jgi:C4-dicarboxylate-specific signal transduction histidine kinase